MLAHCYGTPDILLSRATFNVISSTCAFVLLPLKMSTVVFTGAQLDANNFFVNISAGGKKSFYVVYECVKHFILGPVEIKIKVKRGICNLDNPL